MLDIVSSGSDEKEYRFLVKAGEDLRTDARMQQVLITLALFDYYSIIYAVFDVKQE